MKRIIFILISIMFSLALAQDKAPYANYLSATSSLNGAMITFMVKNISDCNIDTMTVRVAHNGYYDSYDKDVLIVNLKPGESGQAALNLSQVPSEGWGWSIDSVETSKSDRASWVTPVSSILNKYPLEAQNHTLNSALPLLDLKMELSTTR